MLFELLANLFDPALKSTTALCGLWLMGLMLIRTNARGKWKIVGLEWGPLFDPKLEKTGRRVALVFGVAVGLIILRTFCAVV